MYTEGFGVSKKSFFRSQKSQNRKKYHLRQKHKEQVEYWGAGGGGRRLKTTENYSLCLTFGNILRKVL